MKWPWDWWNMIHDETVVQCVQMFVFGYRYDKTPSAPCFLRLPSRISQRIGGSLLHSGSPWVHRCQDLLQRLHSEVYGPALGLVWLESGLESGLNSWLNSWVVVVWGDSYTPAVWAFARERGAPTSRWFRCWFRSLSSNDSLLISF